VIVVQELSVPVTHLDSPLGLLNGQQMMAKMKKMTYRWFTKREVKVHLPRFFAIKHQLEPA
jgi:hypothetical protein